MLYTLYTENRNKFRLYRIKHLQVALENPDHRVHRQDPGTPDPLILRPNSFVGSRHCLRR